MLCWTYDASAEILCIGSLIPFTISRVLSRMPGVRSRLPFVVCWYQRPICAHDPLLCPSGSFGAYEISNSPATALQVGISFSNWTGSMLFSSHVQRLSPVCCGLTTSWLRQETA